MSMFSSSYDGMSPVQFFKWQPLKEHHTWDFEWISLVTMNFFPSSWQHKKKKHSNSYVYSTQSSASQSICEQVTVNLIRKRQPKSFNHSLFSVHCFHLLSLKAVGSCFRSKKQSRENAIWRSWVRTKTKVNASWFFSPSYRHRKSLNYQILTLIFCKDIVKLIWYDKKWPLCLILTPFWTKQTIVCIMLLCKYF